MKDEKVNTLEVIDHLIKFTSKLKDCIDELELYLIDLREDFEGEDDEAG